MKGPLEVDDLRPTLTPSGRQILAHFPIHRGLQRVLHRRRAAINEEVTLQWTQTHDSRKCRHKSGVLHRINIRVGNLDLGRREQIRLHFGPGEMGMVITHCQRGEKTIEINKLPSARRIHQPRTVTALQIDHQLEANPPVDAFQVRTSLRLVRWHQAARQPPP